MSQSESKAKIYYKEQGMDKLVDQPVKSLGKIIASEERITRIPNSKGKSQNKEENLGSKSVTTSKEKVKINLIQNIQQEAKIQAPQKLGLFENKNGINILCETIQTPQVALQNLATLAAGECVHIHANSNDVSKVSEVQKEVSQNIKAVESDSVKVNQHKPDNIIPQTLPSPNPVIINECSDSNTEKEKIDVAVATPLQESKKLSETKLNVQISNETNLIPKSQPQDKALISNDKIESTQEIEQRSKDQVK